MKSKCKHSLFFLIIVFSNVITAYAQSGSACGNIDFENGNFNSWTAYHGTNTGNMGANAVWVQSWDTIGATSNHPGIAREFLIDSFYYDANCYDPMTFTQDSMMTSICPWGGTFSLRLGNPNVGAGCEKISINKIITDTFFTFYYANVSEQPNHSIIDNPYFKYHIYSNGVLIGVDSFANGMTNVPFIMNGGIGYTRWAPVAINLMNYIGTVVTIEFENGDCAYYGHFGYTYIDIPCMGFNQSSVYPEDVNYDLMCDSYDLLGVGIAFGATGSTRTGASNNYIAQLSSDWANSFPIGVNYKHADCNGDGIVDLNDTLAIVLNSGNSHPMRNSNPNHPTKNGGPSITLLSNSTNISSSTYLDIDVQIGSTIQQISNYYGNSTIFNFNNNVIDMNYTPTITYSNNWLGNKNQDFISISKYNSNASQIEFAIAKINHLPANGNGIIAHIRFKIKNNLSATDSFYIYTSNTKATDKNFSELPIDESNTLVLKPVLNNAINETNSLENVMYINSNTKSLYIKNYLGSASQLSIFNSIGQTVQSTKIYDLESTISLANLPPSTYIAVLQSKSKIVKLKFEISK